MAQPTGAIIQYHGKKRSAESEPEGDQPLAKRLDRLHIGMYRLQLIHS